MNRPRHQRRGAAMLEGALTLTATLFMIIGVLDFGQFLHLHQALTERVRGVARKGAIANYDASSVQNLIAYGTTTPASPGAPGYFGLQPSNISVVFSGAGTNAARLTVRVSGLHYLVLSPLIHGTFLNLPVTIAVPMETP
jgi:Flp pilus assembly protein TadG